MTEYDIVAVLWEDHIQFPRCAMVDDPDKTLIPTLTVGLLYKETDKTLTIASQVERYQQGHDDIDYMIILKGTVLSVKKFGSIKLRKIRK